jgi:hypothetical protein
MSASKNRTFENSAQMAAFATIIGMWAMMIAYNEAGSHGLIKFLLG